LIQLLKKEVDLQKELEKDFDADVPEGLQTMSVQDVIQVEHLYLNSDALASASNKYKEVLGLMHQVKDWNKSEKERKWFHW